VMRVKRTELVMPGGQTSLMANGESVPLVWLADVLELARREPAPEPEGYIQVMILSNQKRRIGFAVDGVLEEQEVIVKSLGTQLARVRNIVGATVLGTGRIVLILNTHDLFRSAIKGRGRVEVSSLSTPACIGKVRSAYILVVEDSFTS